MHPRYELNSTQTNALTPEQLKIIAQLRTALTKCHKAGIYLWDNGGTISAVNGKMVDMVTTDSACGDELNNADVTSIVSKAWHGSNADDLLYVIRKY